MNDITNRTADGHTPGPWKVIPSPHGRKYKCVQYGADESYASLEMLPADARLTAAAPDLLDACIHAEAVLSIVEPRSDKAEYLALLRKLRSVVEKARG